MKKLFSFALLLSFALQSASSWAAPSLQSEKAINFFRSEQKPDGSFTKLTVVSSPLYSTYAILLYEYLGLTATKQDRIQKIMKELWTRQEPTGGFSGYVGGPESTDVSAAVYLAAKIAGEPNDSERLQRLEAEITQMGGLKATKSIAPFFMLMGLDSASNCTPAFTTDLLISLDKQLPWIRVMIYPLTYLLEKGKIHHLTAEQTPNLHFGKGICSIKLPTHIGRSIFKSDDKFFKWLLNHMGDDGTLFDFTPTTVPALMALSTQSDKYKDLISQGLETVESFQLATANDGLFQSPGNAAIGETYVVLGGLLDMGVSPSDPLILAAEKFLLSVQQTRSGAFGFSAHNQYFPDSDDTANVIMNLKKLSLARGETSESNPELTAKLHRGLDWLVKIQNHDGGFGTWDKETLMSRILEKAMGKSSLVLSQSVIEHSARIAICLSLFKDESEVYQKSYDKVMSYLEKKQNADGSYSGAWFVDYLFGTAMVVNALGTSSNDPVAHDAAMKGLNFIMDHQQADGGFSESPESFNEGRSVLLKTGSSPAQTGLIVSQIEAFVKESKTENLSALKPKLSKAVNFLTDTQKSNGVWQDLTWTGVTFPKVEYSIYPYVQEISPAQAIGLFEDLYKL